MPAPQFSFDTERYPEMIRFTLHAKLRCLDDPGVRTAACKVEALAAGHVSVEIEGRPDGDLDVCVDGVATCSPELADRIEAALRDFEGYVVTPAIAHCDRGETCYDIGLGNPRVMPDDLKLEGATRLFAGIDWTALRAQHEHLTNLSAYAGHAVGKIEGLINLIGALKDTAVDSFGYPEKVVFGGSPAVDEQVVS